MSKTPEGRALMDLWRSMRRTSGSYLGRPLGSTEGYIKSQRNKIKAKAKAEAIEIVRYMEHEKGFEIPKKEFAKEAITTAVEIMRREDIHPKDKLAAAKAVMEWTLAKPASEANINVKTAESFLEDIAKEMSLDKK